jgi:hypothetical protein
VLEDSAQAVPEQPSQSMREERAQPEPAERVLPTSERPGPGAESAEKAPEARESGSPQDGPEAPETEREPAVGRLAPTRSGTEPAEDSRAFEHASRLLALAHEADAVSPDAASPPDPDPAPGRRSVWRRLARPAAAFLLCFAVGAAVGQWLVPDAGEPAPLPIDVKTPQKADTRKANTVRMVRVQINATPWARIRVDGKEVGMTPLAGVELEEGTHRFEARFPDGSVVERVQTVGPVNRWVVFP